MLATPVRPIPADQLYEPKWDGLIKLNSLRCRADLWSDELAVDRLSVRPQGPTDSHFSALAAVGSVSICDLEVVISWW